MVTATFHYHLMYRTVDTTRPPVNLIVEVGGSGYIDAVIWDRRTGTWNYRPDVASAVLYGPEGRNTTVVVDRLTAESMAPSFTRTPLPTESELAEMSARGRAAMGTPSTRGAQNRQGTQSGQTAPAEQTVTYYPWIRELSGAEKVVNLVVVLTPSENPDAVCWDRSSQSWAYRPGTAAAVVSRHRKEDRPRAVDRGSAERMATGLTSVPLPTEVELARICAEGRATWMPTFGYNLMLNPSSLKPVNLIVVTESLGSLAAVAWDYSERAWTFQPDVAMAVLYMNPERHQSRTVTRAAAEREVGAFATTPLPSEMELKAICLRGLPDW